MARAVIAGAGLAGIACAVRLVKAGVDVTLLEAALRAGGRCRSFHDASLDAEIDNGNHLILSGNEAVMSLLDEIGARDRLVGPEVAGFPFADLKSGERWCVSPNSGRVPFWIFDRGKRVAGTSASDYLSILRMLKRRTGATVTDVVAPCGTLFERFWDPFIVATLNAVPGEAAAELVTPVLWQTFARGAKACRPLVARDGLSDTFIDPALAYIAGGGGEIRTGARVAEVRFDGNRAGTLRCGRDEVAIGAGDVVVLAVTAPVAKSLLPDLQVPQEHSAIVNLHYRVETSRELDRTFIGLINGLAQWVFVRDDIVSITISAAGDVAERRSEEIAREVWGDIAPVLELSGAQMPPCRVIKERRATFLQSPAQVRLRPATETDTPNLFLAGDWTDTGLPATIEGAVRSGNSAAAAALERLGKI